MASAEQGPTPAGPPPLVDSVVRFLVWTGIVASLVAPIVAMVLIWHGGVFTPWGAPGRGEGEDLGFEELQRRLIEARSWMGGTAGGGDARGLVGDANRLRALTAYDGEARGVVRNLEIVVLRFSNPDGRGTSSGAPRRTGYRNVKLDMSGADRTAALIIADVPVLWSVEPNVRGPRAKLAFEGTAPFDIANGFPGVLAGFRIESFAAQHTTQPSDALRQGTEGVERYCRALTLWAAHFGLTLTDARATFADNPSVIHVGDRGVSHDGGELLGRTPFAVCPSKQRLR